MLDIKNVRPKVRQKAVYVTKDNIREFLKLAFPNEFKLDTLIINEEESNPYAVVTCGFSIDWLEAFDLNKWYVSSKFNDGNWDVIECFEDNYDIVKENE